MPSSSRGSSLGGGLAGRKYRSPGMRTPQSVLFRLILGNFVSPASSGALQASRPPDDLQFDMEGQGEDEEVES